MALTKISHDDNDKAVFGTSEDLQIYHSGTHSYIKDSGTGNLQMWTNQLSLLNSGGTESMIQAVENGSVELYHNNSKKFQTESWGAQFFDDVKFDNPDTAGRDVTWVPANDYMRWQDNTKAVFGDGEDLEIYHSGSNYLKSLSQYLYIAGEQIILTNAAANEVTLKTIQNGAVELYYDNVKKFDTYANGINIYGGINQTGTLDIDSDSSKLRLGDGQDFEIYHSGSHGYLHNNTGRIRFETDNLGFGFYKGAGAETLAMFNIDAECSLYYNNAKEFQTVENGIELTSNTSASGTAQTIYLSPTSVTDRSRSCSIAGVNTDGNNNQALVFKTSAAATPVERLKITSDGRVRVPDNGKFIAGDGDDLSIFHTGSYSCIDSITGSLKIRSNTGNMAVFTPDGAVELYYNEAKKCETTNSGLRVYGNLDLEDDEKIRIGTGDDLNIYHSSGVNFIQGANSANIYACADDFAVLNQAGTKTAIWCNSGGSTDLFHNNVKRLETWASGVKTYGTYFETNNVTTYNVSFYQQNNQSYSYDIDVGSEGGNGNSFWLVAGYNHYYNTAYGAHRVGMFSARTTSVDTIFHDNQTSGNAGSWSVSKPNNSTFRVTKSAGSYSGWGHGFVQLTFRKI